MGDNFMDSFTALYTLLKKADKLLCKINFDVEESIRHQKTRDPSDANSTKQIAAGIESMNGMVSKVQNMLTVLSAKYALDNAKHNNVGLDYGYKVKIKSINCWSMHEIKYKYKIISLLFFQESMVSCLVPVKMVNKECLYLDI